MDRYKTVALEEVALKYSDELKTGIELGRITAAYWKVVDAYIRNHLIEYCGKIQIAQMGEEKWKEYPRWRKRTGFALTVRRT